MPPKVRKVEETAIGKRLRDDPKARERLDRIVEALREEAAPEIEALKRSERLTGEDMHTMIY